MEQLIRKVVNSYSTLVKKAAVFERHLEARENADMREALTVIKLQIGAVESWFVLLTVEERVVFRQVLLGNDDSKAANRTAATKWALGLAASGKSPWRIREAAIHKIINFADTHCKLMLALFESI